VEKKLISAEIVQRIRDNKKNITLINSVKEKGKGKNVPASKILIKNIKLREKFNRRARLVKGVLKKQGYLVKNSEGYNRWLLGLSSSCRETSFKYFANNVLGPRAGKDKKITTRMLSEKEYMKIRAEASYRGISKADLFKVDTDLEFVNKKDKIETLKYLLENKSNIALISDIKKEMAAKNCTIEHVLKENEDIEKRMNSRVVNSRRTLKSRGYNAFTVKDFFTLFEMEYKTKAFKEFMDDELSQYVSNYNKNVKEENYER